MILTIDNLDGLGAVDYSAAIDRSQKVAIRRTLNAPSIASGMLCLADSALPVPVRRGRIAMTADSGTVLFTGYLAIEPVPVYAGCASEGAVYRLVFAAVSDEWLLDKQTGTALTGSLFYDLGGSAVTGLLGRAGSALATGNVQPGLRLGVYEPGTAAGWSAHAGAVASQSYAAYRVLDGAMSMNTAGSVTHTFAEGDGSLTIAGLHTAAVRELANDVTLTGALEPTTYWAELFPGDGQTLAFDLAGEPAATSAGHAVLVQDGFNGAAFNTRTWAFLDPGAHLALGAAGLVLNGGNGFDGQTTVVAHNAVEMGGTLVAQLAGVVMNAASAGVLCGFYAGTIVQRNCLAGFNVRQSGGDTIVTPLVNGVETGTGLTLLEGHSYSLRLHLHCAEPVRVRQSFYAMVESAGTAQVNQFGGGLIDAPLSLVFAIRDEGLSSNTPVTVLYDGSVPGSYATTSFCAVNSVQLFGAIGSIELARTGTAWVRVTDGTTGTTSTRLAGSANEGVDCTVSAGATGRITFFPGRQPALGDTLTVLYRGRARAVARLADAASLAAEAAGGGSGTARWLGRVDKPVARSSEDCENAAQAVLAFATNRSAAVSGSYVAVNPAAANDIWPGDVLAVTANGSTVNLMVRKIELDEQGASPEALTYRIAFANDWAEGLGLQLAEGIATDVPLPAAPLELAPGQTPASSGHVLASLQQMAVLACTASAITVDAGTDPPAGGGFEVRRSNANFGMGTGASPSGDLVLRTPVRGFTIPRGAAQETFFIRMYDGATPAHSSRWPAAIFTHVPIS